MRADALMYDFTLLFIILIIAAEFGTTRRRRYSSSRASYNCLETCLCARARRIFETGSREAAGSLSRWPMARNCRASCLSCSKYYVGHLIEFESSACCHDFLG